MFGPFKRKEESDHKTRFCTEGCCSPKTFCTIIWAIFALFYVWGFISLLFLTPSEVCTTVMDVTTCADVEYNNTGLWIQCAINTCIMVLIVMAWIKPDNVTYRSILSYIADIGVLVSFVFMIITTIALFSVGVMTALITCAIWCLILWFQFWSAQQIREAVFRQQYNKGETFDGHAGEAEKFLAAHKV